MGPGGVVRLGAVVAVPFVVRVVAKWRVERRDQRMLRIPLFDAAELEAVCEPRKADDDNADVLAELRDTMLHLNRMAYAEEFWNLPTQLELLYANVGTQERASITRAVLRMLSAKDGWLQLEAARTCAVLGVTEAIPHLDRLLNSQEGDDESTFQHSKRYRGGIAEAITALRDSAAEVTP